MFHIIQTTFTGKGFKKNALEKNDDWIKERINIFKKYSLPSFRNQTNQNFLHWISWRPEEENKSFIKDLKQYLEELKYNFVFTYWGWGSYDVLSTDEHKSTVVKRLSKSLKEVRKFCPGNDDIYFTVRFASDDLYWNGAFKEIQETELKEGELLYFLNGYIYNLKKHLLADWNSPGGKSPFYTVFFKAEIFWDARKHLNYNPPCPTYEEAYQKFRSKRIQGRKYIVLNHGLNHSVQWNSGWVGPAKSLAETREILKDFSLKGK